MELIIYLLIVAATVTQSASTKAFNRCSAHSAVFNAVKAGTALILFALMAAPGFQLHWPTLLFGLLYGGCMCLSMYAGYKALCLGPMALSSMLVSFSVLIPLIWGVTAGQETLNAVKCLALVLLLCAIVLTNADKIKRGQKKQENHALWLTFVGITLLCNGVASVLQKQHQTLYPESYSREFMFFAMLLCAVIFGAAVLKKLSLAEIRSAKGKRYGVLSGLTNGMANFLTLLLAGFENASILFPVISAGTILGALLCGRFVFKEKLKINHYAALLTGIVAVVLLKL